MEALNESAPAHVPWHAWSMAAPATCCTGCGLLIATWEAGLHADQGRSIISGVRMVSVITAGTGGAVSVLLTDTSIRAFMHLHICHQRAECLVRRAPGTRCRRSCGRRGRGGCSGGWCPPSPPTPPSPRCTTCSTRTCSHSSRRWAGMLVLMIGICKSLQSQFTKVNRCVCTDWHVPHRRRTAPMSESLAMLPFLHFDSTQAPACSI